jgi:hypothetical protein
MAIRRAFRIFKYQKRTSDHVVHRFTAGRRVDLGADDPRNPASRRELGLGYKIATMAWNRWSSRIRHATVDPRLPLPDGEAGILRFEFVAVGESRDWRYQCPAGQSLPRTREDADLHDKVAQATPAAPSPQPGKALQNDLELVIHRPASCRRHDHNPQHHSFTLVVGNSSAPWLLP